MSAGSRMNLFMAPTCVLIFAVSEVGLRFAALAVSGFWWSLVAAVIVAAVCLPVAGHFHEKGRKDWRDNILVVPWCALLAVLTPLPLLLAARMRMPLCDSAFQHWEGNVGLTAAGIMRWTNSHSLSLSLDVVYRQMALYLLVAIFVPSVLNKREAKVFVVANTIALCVGAVCFAMFPVVGPWWTERFSPSPLQLEVQRTLLTLRLPATSAFSLSRNQLGIVGFPSFHVIWAVLCAAALWGFRRLRPLVALASFAIIVSTITTGWHYILDVAGGISVAVVALIGANIILGSKPEICLASNSEVCEKVEPLTPAIALEAE